MLSQIFGREKCSICLKHMGLQRVFTSCGHCFHGSCIYAWLTGPNSSHKCPLCRQRQPTVTLSLTSPTVVSVSEPFVGGGLLFDDDSLGSALAPSDVMVAPSVVVTDTALTPTTLPDGAAHLTYAASGYVQLFARLSPATPPKRFSQTRVRLPQARRS